MTATITLAQQMNPVPERFKLVSNNLLNQWLNSISRKAGAVVAQGNFGNFNEFSGQLEIPVSNVGTYLFFVVPVEDYVYIQMTITGAAALISVIGEGQTLEGVEAAASGTILGTYVMTFPFCGKVTGFLLENPGPYVVTKIEVFAASRYTVFERDLNQLRPFVDIDGTTFDGSDDGEWITFTVADTAVLTCSFVGTIMQGFTGICGVRIVQEPGVLVPAQVIRIFDGQSVYTCNSFVEFAAIFRSGILPAGCYITYTNDSGEEMKVQVKVQVCFEKGLSTAYGAEVEVTASELSANLMFPFRDTYTGSTKPMPDRYADSGQGYVNSSTGLANLKIDGTGSMVTNSPGSNGEVFVNRESNTPDYYLESRIVATRSGAPHPVGPGAVTIGIRASDLGGGNMKGYMLYLETCYLGVQGDVFWRLDSIGGDSGGTIGSGTVSGLGTVYNIRLSAKDTTVAVDIGDNRVMTETDATINQNGTYFWKMESIASGGGVTRFLGIDKSTGDRVETL